MTIAIDAGEMGVLRKRLREAAEEISDAVPNMPGIEAFGPAVLGGAVASFESEIGRQAQALHDRWTALDGGIRETFDDMSKVEANIVAGLVRMQGHPE